jgi:hypothetical protein
MGMIANLLRVTAAELEAYKDNSVLLQDRIYRDEAPDDPAMVDIDKAWDGIVYLLTGQNSSASGHPLARIIFSGRLVDANQDLGYGPAHYLNPEEVVAIHRQIATISVNELAEKFNAEEMKIIGVYPNAWDHDDIVDYLTEYFETVQEVYALAAERGEAIITFIN